MLSEHHALSDLVDTAHKSVDVLRTIIKQCGSRYVADELRKVVHQLQQGTTNAKQALDPRQPDRRIRLQPKMGDIRIKPDIHHDDGD